MQLTTIPCVFWKKEDEKGGEREGEAEAKEEEDDDKEEEDELIVHYYRSNIKFSRCNHGVVARPIKHSINIHCTTTRPKVHQNSKSGRSVVIKF